MYCIKGHEQLSAGEIESTRSTYVFQMLEFRE